MDVQWYSWKYSVVPYKYYRVHYASKFFLFIAIEVCKQKFGPLYSVDDSLFTGPTNHRRIKPFIGTASGNISGMWDSRWTPSPGRSEVWKVPRCNQKGSTSEELSRRAQRLQIQCNTRKTRILFSLTWTVTWIQYSLSQFKQTNHKALGNIRKCLKSTKSPLNLI